MNVRRIHFIPLILALSLFGCSTPQREPSYTEKLYVESSSQLFSLRFVYNSCKAHLSSDGQGKARICEEIASVMGKEKSHTLARVILDDFKIANQGRPWTVSTRESVLYFTFMKMQAERHLRGEISWYEMDYSIMSKGDDLTKSIRPARR